MRHLRVTEPSALALAATLLLFLLLLASRVAAQSSTSNEMRSAKKDDRSGAELFFKRLPKNFIQPRDDAEKLLLREYGAMLVAGKGVRLPTKVFFSDEADVAAFQTTVKRSTYTFGSIQIELQSAAMEELLQALHEARSVGLTISPRGADSARRGYQQTVALWASRVNPGLAHWTANGKITRAEAQRIKALSPYHQVPEILRLERQGIFFAKNLSKSIIYSVAPPGSSQHLSMLALDVKEFNDHRVRGILAKHGWYQTVVSDLPHFTFLGHDEADLPSRGLKLVISDGRRFWIPDLPASDGAIVR